MKLGKILLVLSLVIFFQVNYPSTILAEVKEIKVKHKDKRIIVRKDLVDVSVVVARLSLHFLKKVEGAFKEIEGNLRFYGEPIILEARYNSEQEENKTIAQLEWDTGEGKGRKSRDIVLERTPEDHSIYRSKVFYVLPPPIPKEYLQPPPDIGEQSLPEIEL